MSTAKFLAAVVALLAALSVVAALWKPERGSNGKIPLVWVSDNNPARAAQIAAFNAENPDLFLTLDYGNSNVQKIILQCSSGVGPDIYDFSDDQLESYASAGILWDVTEAAERMGFSGRTSAWPGGVNSYCYQGRQYGFPCNTGASTLLYNKNVFDHFGIPYPKGILTWDEFFDLAKSVNSATNPQGAKGRDVFAVTGLEYRVFFETQRGEFFHEDGRLQISGNEALRKSIDMLRDVVFKYKLTPTTVDARQLSGQGGWGAGNLNQFAAGRYAMTVTGHWALIGFNRAYQKQMEALKNRGVSESDIKDPLERPLRLGSVLLPKFAGREPVYRVGSRSAGINSRSPRREEALRFLQYLAGPVYSKLLNEEADLLPGNPKYAHLGITPGPEALSRIQLQKTTEEAMAYGYVPRSSPFLLMSDVIRVLKEQVSRLESDPAISTETLLDAAEQHLRALMRRNLDRSASLREEFVKRFGEEAYRNLR